MKTLIIAFCLTFFVKDACMGGVAVVGSLSREKKTQPGETFEGIILLKNNDDQPAEVKVYQTDYLFSADGKNVYGEPGTNPRSNAGWITVSPRQVLLPAKETVSVYYKGRVPEGAEFKGTYWSMIMVEPSTTPAPVIKGQQEQIALGLQTLIRFGIQIVTEIGETAEQKLRIVDKKLAVQDGKKVLQLDFENTGQRMLVPSVWLELFSQEGVSLGKFEGGRWRIFPGCSLRYKIDLSDLPPGKYNALVIADNGDDYVMGAQYALEVEK